MPRYIKLRNRRILRRGFMRWDKPKGSVPALKPAASGGAVYPPFIEPVDYLFTEDWKEVGDAWRPVGFTVDKAEMGKLTDWQVVDNGKAFIASVGLPELASAVGFPAVIFFSVSLSHPSNESGIDPKGEWSLNIDVAQALEDAIISPLQSYVGRNGVAFAGYVRGLVKNLDLPVVRLAMSCFWNNGFTTYSGEFLSNVTVSSPFIEFAAQPAQAHSVTCQRCALTASAHDWEVL